MTGMWAQPLAVVGFSLLFRDRSPSFWRVALLWTWFQHASKLLDVPPRMLVVSQARGQQSVGV